MYLLRELPEHFYTLNQRAQTALDEVLRHSSPVEEAKTLPALNNFTLAHEFKDYYFRIREGTARLVENGRIIAFLDEGDMLGLECFLPLPECAVATDFAIIVDAYSKKNVQQVIQQGRIVSESWITYLSCIAEMFSLALCVTLPKESELNAKALQFHKGEQIIEEASSSNDVYTLVEGHAVVCHSGIQVGEILPGEIFGVLAALTTTPRTADVIATTHSVVTCIPKEQFVELIQCRPNMAVKVVEDLARTVVDLNKLVVDLQKEQPSVEGTKPAELIFKG